MAIDKVLVERETCGALCGRHCKYVDDDNAGCALFDAPMVWHSDGRYKRCPACLATPSARELTPEMVQAVRGAYRMLMRNACPNEEDAAERLRAAFGPEEATK